MYSVMGDPASESAPRYAQFIVPQRHVKRVKTALEGKGLFNKRVGIGRYEGGTETEAHLTIPTLISFPDDSQPEESSSFLEETCTTLSLYDILPSLTLTPYTPPSCSPPPLNPLVSALLKALNTLPPELLSSLNLSIPTLQASFPPSYNIYPPMLLLPPNALASPPWKILLAALNEEGRDKSFWGEVAAGTGVSHVALNAGIPPGTDAQGENVLRSPTNLLPLYGDFGTKDGGGEGKQEFETALWVSTTQNGIFQTWAPAHTMFSRGNVKEKARILHLPSVAQAARESSEEGCTAIDLYAGIGYFAFSYKRAGVKKVLCWEINPYSIEGLRRGAQGNNWSSSLIPPSAASTPLSQTELDADFLVFPEGNENAVASLSLLRSRINVPPVRHVNLGFLPTTRKAWGTAVGVLDRGLGGWIHVHENVGVNEVEERRDEVVGWMRGYMREKGWRGEVRGGHVERVKMYAPGVVHVVFDVWVGGEGEGGEEERV